MNDVIDDVRAPGESLLATPDAPDVSECDDPYAAATSEFYDLLATGHWDVFGHQLLELLAPADPTIGPVIDVGSGTGVGLPYLRAAVPDAAILAIEPSRAMRTALHARLSIDDDLRRVTTVDPRPFATAELPERACALVASAALGHFTDGERHRLWRYVAEHMPPGAPAVVEVLPPDRPLSVAPVRYRELRVGDHVYEGWQCGEPADERHMAWTMTYRVLRDGREVARDEVRATWRCLGVDDLRAEIDPYGLALTEHVDAVVVTAR